MSTKTIEDRTDEIIKNMLGMKPKVEAPLESATIPASGKESRPICHEAGDVISSSKNLKT